MNSVNPAVGIDLGTTNTVVAVQTNTMGPELLSIPQPNLERKILDPSFHIKSAVFFENSEDAVVGAFASRRFDSFVSIKSKIGTRWRMQHPYNPKITLSPAYISALILKVAYNELVKKYPGWDRSAIITVPASFNTDQRNDTLMAANMAGFEKVRLLDEPTAAFYYYFDQNRDTMGENGHQSILVFDFGGGTLDVSIIKAGIQSNAILIDAIGRSRYNNLGGDDIDLDLASFVFAFWHKTNAQIFDCLDDNTKKKIYKFFIQKACLFKEEAEDYLSNNLELNEFVINETVETSNGNIQIKINKVFSRFQYEEITGRFFSNKEDINIFRPIGQALKVAEELSPGFCKDDIDLVLYTGGASRMNGVKATLSAFFRPKPCYSINDEEACNTVALGAACCRYDELNRQREVSMTVRLLEGILTRDDEGHHFVTIVPMTCQPSKDFKKLEYKFKTMRPLINMKIPLFRGTGPDDHHLSPMQDLELPLKNLVPANTNYNIFYRMTENKTIELKAIFELSEQRQLEVAGEVIMDFDGKSKANIPRLECEVNRQGV